jgi:hypothetical protein
MGLGYKTKTYLGLGFTREICVMICMSESISSTAIKLMNGRCMWVGTWQHLGWGGDRSTPTWGLSREISRTVSISQLPDRLLVTWAHGMLLPSSARPSLSTFRSSGSGATKSDSNSITPKQVRVFYYLEFYSSRTRIHVCTCTALRS